jgi:hypothetical protein
MFTPLLAVGALAVSSLLTPVGTPRQPASSRAAHARPGGLQPEDTDRLVGTWQRASPGQTVLYQWKFSHDGKYTWKFGTIVGPGANADSLPRSEEVETGTFKVTDGRLQLTPDTCRTSVRNRSLPGGGYTADLDAAPARAYSWSIRTGVDQQQVLKLADAGRAPSGSCLPIRRDTAFGFDYGDSGEFASVD